MRYSTVGEVGRGGMGVLYLARSEGPGGFERLVAIKRLHSHLSEQRSFLNMLLDEARIAAQIHHPNVVSVYEVGEDEEAPYIVMDYISGVTLAAILSQAPPLPIPLAVHLITSAAEGLHAAHEVTDKEGELLGVVHRDVSPQNLLVGFDGVLRVTDFGIAKAAGKLAQTVVGARKGKPAYMAPEQVVGEEIDRRTDVFALGVVLWETLTQHRLFRGEDDSETTQLILAGSIQPPSELRPDVPKALDRMVLKALARDPTDRHQTARELADELLQVLAERSLVVTPGVVEQFLAENMKKSQIICSLETKTDADPEPTAPAARAAPQVMQLYQASAEVENTRSVHEETVHEASSPGFYWIGLMLILVIGGILFVTSMHEERQKPTLAKQLEPEKPEKPQQQHVTIRFRLHPADATIRVDGSIVASSITLPRGTEHTLEVSHDGYRTHTSRFVADQPSAIEIDLARQQQKKKRKKKKKKPRTPERLVSEGDL